MVCMDKLHKDLYCNMHQDKASTPDNACGRGMSSFSMPYQSVQTCLSHSGQQTNLGC